MLVPARQLLLQAQLLLPRQRVAHFVKHHARALPKAPRGRVAVEQHHVAAHPGVVGKALALVELRIEQNAIGQGIGPHAAIESAQPPKLPHELAFGQKPGVVGAQPGQPGRMRLPGQRVERRFKVAIHAVEAHQHLVGQQAHGAALQVGQGLGIGAGGLVARVGRALPANAAGGVAFAVEAGLAVQALVAAQPAPGRRGIEPAFLEDPAATAVAAAAARQRLDEAHQAEHPAHLDGDGRAGAGFNWPQGRSLRPALHRTQQQ